MQSKHSLRLWFTVILLMLSLLSSCQSASAPMPSADSSAESGELASGIAYGYRTYSYAEGFSFGLAVKWEMRPVGRVTVNFCAPISNRYAISLTLHDSDDRLLGESGLLAPGNHIKEIRLAGIPPETGEICVTIYAYDENGDVVYRTSRYETLIRDYT